MLCVMLHSQSRRCSVSSVSGTHFGDISFLLSGVGVRMCFGQWTPSHFFLFIFVVSTKNSSNFPLCFVRLDCQFCEHEINSRANSKAKSAFV